MLLFGLDKILKIFFRDSSRRKDSTNNTNTKFIQKPHVLRLGLAKNKAIGEMKRSRVIASSSPFPWRFSNGMLQGTFSLSLVLGAFVFLYFNVSLLHMHQAKEENDGINNVNNVPPSSPSTAFDKSNNERYFLPGSLPMNRTETLHKCYFPVSNKLPTIQGCTISEKYKIIFYMTPKAGSSTGRHVVKNDFEGVDHEVRCRIPEGENESEWIQMAVLRNPTTRAFASYEEMFVRHLGRVQHIPERFRRFMIPFQDFIYLNYSALFDNAAVRIFVCFFAPR